MDRLKGKLAELGLILTKELKTGCYSIRRPQIANPLLSFNDGQYYDGPIQFKSHNAALFTATQIDGAIKAVHNYLIQKNVKVSEQQPTNKYAIPDRLSQEELLRLNLALNDLYRGKRYLHKESNAFYQIAGATIINQNGRAEWGILYHPLYPNGLVLHAIKYTQPMSEFLDGRFQSLALGDLILNSLEKATGQNK